MHILTTLSANTLPALVAKRGHKVSFATQKTIHTAIKAHHPQVLLLHNDPLTIHNAAAAVMGWEVYPALIVVGGVTDGAVLGRLDEMGWGVEARLLPPLCPHMVASALDRILRPNAAQVWAWQHTSKPPKFITVQSHRGLRLIDVTKIYYVVCDQKYLRVRHTQGEVLIDGTLCHLAQRFAGELLKIHRSALIGIRFLSAIECHNGHWLVRFCGIDDTLPIARRELAGVKKILKELC